RASYPLAAPRRIALAQRRLHRDDPEHRAHDVDHGSAGAHWLSGRTGHVGKSCMELYDFVQSWPVFIRPGEITLQCQIDQERIERRELLVPAAQPLHRAGAVILQYHIGIPGQPMQHALALGRFEVDYEATFVAIERRKESRREPAELARVITG